MEVYKSKYLSLEFFTETQVIEWTWFPTSSEMKKTEYQQETLNYVDIVLKYKPKKVLGDIRNMFFPIGPELQEWTNQTIFPPILEIGLKTVAFVASEEIITQLSTQQTMEEEEGSKFTTRYFNTKEEAKEWLLSI